METKNFDHELVPKRKWPTKTPQQMQAKMLRRRERCAELYGNSLNDLLKIRKNLNFIQLDVTGPQNKTEYSYSVEVDGNTFIGKGQNCNEAKMHAAAQALKNIDPSYKMKNLNLSNNLNVRDHNRNQHVDFTRYSKFYFDNSLNDLETIRDDLTFSFLSWDKTDGYHFSLKVDEKEFFGKGATKFEAKVHAAAKALNGIDRTADLNVSKKIHKNYSKTPFLTDRMRLMRYNASINRAKLMYDHALDRLEDLRDSITYSLISSDDVNFSYSIKVDDREFFGKGESKFEAKMQAAFEALKTIKTNKQEPTPSHQLKEKNLAETNDLNVLKEICPDMQFTLVKTDFSVSIVVEGKTYVGVGESLDESKNNVASVALKSLFGSASGTAAGADCVEELSSLTSEGAQEDIPTGDGVKEVNADDKIKSFNYAHAILKAMLPDLIYLYTMKVQSDGTVINVCTAELEGRTYTAEKKEQIDAENKLAAIIFKNIFRLVYKDDSTTASNTN